MRILVVEDNPKLAGSIRQGLTEQGYSVDVCHSGYEAEDMAATEPYDLVLLDLMLPDRDGVEVCRNLRRRGLATPILMLTALSGTENKVAGLDVGADDYVTKPFDLEELHARIRALLRRGQAGESARLSHAGLEVDLIARRVTRDGEALKLSPKEFSLLEYLMRNPDRPLSRSSIARKVWDIDHDASSNLIDVYISALRKKVDKNFETNLIHTVIGVGYRFGSKGQ